MGPTVRIGIYDEVCEGRERLRAALEGMPELVILGDCKNWQELQTLLSTKTIDVLLINLDAADGGFALTIINQASELSPDCGLIGLSWHTEPEVIIGAIRAGCQQFVRCPIDPDDLRAALDRTGHTNRAVVDRSLKVAVIGASGGAGATTLACNLAIELAQATESPCALMDMNLQYGDVASTLDLKPKFTIADVCEKGREVDDTVVASALTKLPMQVNVLTAPHDIEQAEKLSPEAIEQTLNSLGRMFPFVVLDVPRYFSPQVAAAMSLADRALIVTQLTVPHLMHAERIHRSLLNRGASDECIDFVLSRHNANFARLTRQEAEKHFGRPIYAAIPNDYKKLGAARDHGTYLQEMSPNNPVRLAIHELACRLASDHLGEDWNRDRDEGGLLGRFRRRRGVRVR